MAATMTAVSDALTFNPFLQPCIAKIYIVYMQLTESGLVNSEEAARCSPSPKNQETACASSVHEPQDK